LKYTLLYIAILITVSVNGQPSVYNDTIKISEVVISGRRASSDLFGFKTISIDSNSLANYSHRTVAELLSSKSGIFIKSYGMGGTATPSFRGTGAGHTQVAWNGITISSPMLGQADLSLLPAGMTDNIQISFGGASMALNSGGIGGMINLESKPVWTKRTSFSVSPGVGSFGHYSAFVSLSSGTSGFQSKTNAFFSTAENNFRYLNSYLSATPVWETRTNSQVEQKGFIQELHYKWQNNVISARLWYQSADRNLPSSMLTPQQGNPEKQSDESIRLMMNYDIEKAGSKIFFTGAWMMSDLNYTNTLASIDSRNMSKSAVIKAGAEKKIFGTTRISTILSEEISQVRSNNYDGNITRNSATLTISTESQISDLLGTSFLVREILDRNKLLLPDFSAGMEFRFSESQEDIIKANISRNSKIPTMNDMYWVPGGNRNLKNEYAFISELSYILKRDLSSSLMLDYEISLFRNSIKDLILWRPGIYSYWTADNIQNVSTMGVETSVSLKYKSGRFTTSLDASYSFTKAYDDADESPKNQLLYIPENQASVSWQMVYGNISFTWLSNLTGRRYITADNSKALPGYNLNTISTGYKFIFKEQLLGIHFCIDNLFDIDYQSIAYFPQPGRSYSMKLLIQFNK
jgi:iron complex outermembrane receptor protein